LLDPPPDWVSCALSVQVVPERVNTHALRLPLPLYGSPISAVLPSWETATEMPNCALPLALVGDSRVCSTSGSTWSG
jgi:hypothetical protein